MKKYIKPEIEKYLISTIDVMAQSLNGGDNFGTNNDFLPLNVSNI